MSARKPSRRASAGGPSTSWKRAEMLWQRRRFDEALKAYAEAVRNGPRDPRLLLDAARAFGQRHRRDRCQALLDQAIGLGPRRYELLLAAGQIYRGCGMFAEAEGCFRRAVPLLDRPLEAEFELAFVLERGHQLQEAHTRIRRIVQWQPEWPAARVLEARVQRRQGDLSAAEATLRDTLRQARISPSLAVEALGELFRTLDAQARFDEAWQVLAEAKQRQAASCQPEEQAARHVDQRLTQFVRDLQPGDLASWWAASDRDRGSQVALLTGFPRSGTTLLEQILDAHPGIITLEEQDIFASVVIPQALAGTGREPIAVQMADLDETRRRQTSEVYLALAESSLRQPLNGRLLIDKNPALTPMIPLIVRLMPGLRLMVMRRDPRDVVASCFLRILPLNPVSVSFLTVAGTVERYRRDMDMWQQFQRSLPPEAWCEIRYEDLVTNWSPTVRRLLQFLGCPWDEQVAAYRDRSRQKHILSPTYESVWQPISSAAVGRWRNYAAYLERDPAWKLLQPMVAADGGV